MEWPRRTVEYTSRLCRPVTDKVLNILHSILGGLSREYIRDPNILVTDAFNMFHQNFVDSCLIAFLEREVGNFSSYPKVDWYTEELRDIKNHLDLINELYDRYKIVDLKLLRNQTRLRYKLEMYRAKRKAYDKTILNSSNQQKLCGISLIRKES
ncbi:hypothetical protein HHI36_007017 [Cryptolaemus montrouzieri]|uniref:Uncharacterized protein n=1 Tax=Cryptolaemus montrouzieri TaxID=559131 RepID=A0ABD2MNE3_9CUCU